MRQFSFLKTPRFLGILLLLGAVILLSFSLKDLIWQEKVLGQTVTEEGNCAPVKKLSGATTPGFDCQQGGSAGLTLTACIPEGCPLDGATIEFEKTIASCPGRDWVGCDGTCGAAATKSTLTIPAGQRCVFETIHCSPPESCGSCQVNIDGNGVRRFQKANCSKVTATPKPTNVPAPTNTVGSTNTSVPTPTSEPTATNTPEPTATNSPEPTATNTPAPGATATPAPQVLGVSALEILPKTGFDLSKGLRIGLLGIALSLLSII